MFFLCGISKDVQQWNCYLDKFGRIRTVLVLSANAFLMTGFQ